MAELQTHFGQANTAYHKYRPGYPPSLFEKIFHHLDTPCSAALDLGAGTGISSNYLAKYFCRVTAVEPDSQMISGGSFAPGITVINDLAEHVDFAADSFQLVTSGNAFYWMDGEKVIPKIARWLQPGGIFAAYRYELPLTDCEATNQLILKENQERWEPFKHPRLKDPGYTRRVIGDSGLFSQVERHKLANPVALTRQQLVGFYSSASFVLRYLADHPNPQAYLREFEGSIPQPTLYVDFGLELILAKK